jgi:hypothetical protein
MLLGTTLLVAACNSPASIDWVPGTYVMNRGSAADTLIVRLNHTYERRYVLPGSAAVIDRGAWSVDTLAGEQYVVFEPFWARWHAETGGSPPTGGFWPVQPERTITGAIVLRVSEDEDREYRRVSVSF